MKCRETVKGKSIPGQNVLVFSMKALGAPMLVVGVMFLIRSQLLSCQSSYHKGFYCECDNLH